MSYKDLLNDAPLGDNTSYKQNNSSGILYPIPREEMRSELDRSLIFSGFDVWNAYEISWLNLNGKPEIAVGEFYIPADSKNIIESKSLKLYLNSFNERNFSSSQKVNEIITLDLSKVTGASVCVILRPPNYKETIRDLPGENIDHLDIVCDNYANPARDMLISKEGELAEEINSHLLKSNCPVTNQPDWGSLYISYSGKKKIDKSSLLKYIVSFRNHNDFHEHCVEKIFQDLNLCLSPNSLTVYARYTRRGGLDINPYRSTKHIESSKMQSLNFKLLRQ